VSEIPLHGYTFMKYIAKRKSHDSGFTLIEMIVTVSIVAILSSIAAPSFRGMLENNRATVEANELVSGLLLARSEALKRRNNVTLCTSIDQTTCAGNGETNFAKGWIVFQDCNDTQVLDTNAGNGITVDCGNGVLEDETIIKAQIGSDKMVVTKNGPGADQHFFTYNFTGRADLAITFEVRKIAGGPALKAVRVARTGRVRTVTCTNGICPP